MPDFNHLHDWLLKTLSGLLIVGVIASLIAAMIWKFGTWFLNKVSPMLPMAWRWYSRRITQRELDRLNLIHNNVYELVLELIRIFGNVLTGSMLLTLILLGGFHHAGHAPPVDKWNDFEMTMVLLTALPFILCFAVFMSVAFFGLPLSRLYKDLKNYDRVKARLEKSLVELDTP